MWLLMLCVPHFEAKSWLGNDTDVQVAFAFEDIKSTKSSGWYGMEAEIPWLYT